MDIRDMERLLNEAYKDFGNNHSEIFKIICSFNDLEKKLNNKKIKELK